MSQYMCVCGKVYKFLISPDEFKCICGLQIVLKNEYTIHDILANYNEKLERKLRIHETEFQPLIEEGIQLNSVQYTKREVLLSQISMIKMFISDLEYLIEKNN